MNKRGHAVWDAMPHTKRVKAVATVFAYKDKEGIEALCRELYMVKWILAHEREILSKVVSIRGVQ